MSSKKALDLKSIIDTLSARLRTVSRYGFVLFLIFVALLYGFVLLRVNNLSNAQPSSTDVSGQVQAAQIPHIDQAVVSQLQSLQDHSVSVQALFNQARSNPFQE